MFHDNKLFPSVLSTVPVYPGQIFGFTVVALFILCIIVIPLDIFWYRRRRLRSKEANKRIYHYAPDTALVPKPVTHLLDEDSRDYIYYLIYHNIPHQTGIVQEANEAMSKKSFRHAWTTVMQAPEKPPEPQAKPPPSPPVKDEPKPPRHYRTAHMSMKEDKVPILSKVESEPGTDIEITNIRDEHFVGTNEFLAARGLSTTTKKHKKKTIYLD